MTSGSARPGTAAPSAPPTPSATATATPPSATIPPSPPPPHIMVIVLENREYSQVVEGAPRLMAVAHAHGLATQAYAMGHPSEPNYIALITGSTQGITDDGEHRVHSPSLAGQLQAAGIGWRAYMGGLPRPCDPVASAGSYAKKHDPFLSVSDVVDSPPACARVVPQSQLSGDLAAGTAPPFAWVSPDLCADGHDCSMAVADAATAALVARVTASSWFDAGASIVVTWDEGGSDAGCCGSARGGHVALLVVGPGLGAGTTLDSPLDQVGMLRGIEEAYGLPLLGEASCACSGDLLPLLRPRP